MAPTATPMMTVLHLELGHVLAAVSSGSQTVTVADVTGGTYLAVRVPGSPLQVNVTAELLTATLLPLDDDVLNRPLEHLVRTVVPKLISVGEPTELDRATPVGTQQINAAENTKVLSLWQAGDELEVSEDTLNKDGYPVGNPPLGATHRLVACPGQPLAYEILP
jgi:hypothetical protein